MNPRRVSPFCYLGLIHYLLYSTTYLIKSFSLKILLRVFPLIFNDDSITDFLNFCNVETSSVNFIAENYTISMKYLLSFLREKIIIALQILLYELFFLNMPSCTFSLSCSFFTCFLITYF